MKRTRILTLATAAILGGSAVVAAVSVERPARAAEDPEVSETLSIRVEVVRKRLYAIQANGQVDTFRVSVGSQYHPTPLGEFTIRRMIWNPSWTPPPSDWARDSKPAGPGDPDNPMGKVKMFFKHPDYYIHGTNQDALVGHVTSHGCVRLRNADAVRLARMVMEHGGVERPEGWFQRILERVRSSETVGLARAVPVTVVEGEPWPLLGEPLVADDEPAAAAGGR